MGLHVVRVLRQGIWASLTGGWYFEPEQHVFSNTLQMYFWLFLIVFPFSLYVKASSHNALLVCSVYSGIIGVIFITCLCICHFINKLFDSAEVVTDCDRKDDQLRSNEKQTEPQSDSVCKKTGNESLIKNSLTDINVSSEDPNTCRTYLESKVDMDFHRNQSDVKINADVEEPEAGGSQVKESDIDQSEIDVWKDFIFTPQPHPSRNSPGPLGCNLRSKRAPDGLRAESFQTRSSFHIPEDYEQSEDSNKKVYSVNDMKVQSTGDMKDIIREGKSLLSSDSESFEVEKRIRTDTSESLISATPSSRIVESKKDFSKIMSEPQLVNDKTQPISQPAHRLKPKRVRLKIDDNVLSNEAPSLGHSSSLVSYSDDSSHLASSSGLPTSNFELDQKLVIQEVEEETDSNSPMVLPKISQLKFSHCEKGSSHSLETKFASSSSSSIDEKSILKQSTSSDTPQKSPDSPIVYIPETLVNTLPPEKARQILGDECATSNVSSKRPRAMNTSKFLNVLTDGRLDVNSAVANDHNNTAPGSVHCFVDEAGNWVMYKFAETTESQPCSSSSNNQLVAKTDRSSSDPITSTDVFECDSEPSSSSGIRFRGFSLQQLPEVEEATIRSSLYSDSSETEDNLTLASSHQARNARNFLTNADMDTVDLLSFLQGASSSDFNPLRTIRPEFDSLPRHMLSYRNPMLSRPPTRCGGTTMPTNTKPKYRLFVDKSKSKSFVVNFDRQQLSSFMDIRQTWHENTLIVILSMLVAFLGFELLFSEIYHDLLMFQLCVVIGTSQYSLIKSVQPDSASPMHGYNRVIVFSRALYFCLFASILLFIHSCLPCNSFNSHNSVTFYSIEVDKCQTLETLYFVFTWIVLLLPWIFLLGLLPQCNTFILFSLEQLDILLFGGTAKSSLVGSVFSFLISVITVFWMSLLAMWAVDYPKNSQNHFLFTFYCSLLPPVGYFLSRVPSEPSFFMDMFRQCCCKFKKQTCHMEQQQELPRTLKTAIFKRRLENSVFVCPLLFILFFALHISQLFSEPIMSDLVLDVLCGVAGLFGFMSNYILLQIRKRLPWLCFDKPCVPLKAELSHNSEYCLQQARVLVHEYFQIWSQVIEKYLLNTVVIVAITTRGVPLLTEKYGLWIGCVLSTMFSLKLMRYNYCNLNRMYQVVLLGAVLFGHDLKQYSELQLMDYFMVTIIIPKAVEVFKKLQFVFTYVAPWQIPWGSTFHAFAQPISIPHSALLFTQAFISSVFGAPLSPFMGSALFLMSYPRPVKFWEKDYKTKRQDVTNKRLALHLDPSPVCDEDNCLNSIYYEHLTRSLQIYLAGDISFGRWGNVEQGDFFLMASESLNCLVHIIEVGNGFVTFQVRGLEFRGTYCHQREVDAINEEPKKDTGFCCCTMRKIPGLLSLNEAFSQRWLAWEVLTNSYIIDGYNITQLNSAQHNFASYEQKSTHSRLYVQSVIFLLVRCKKLESWLRNDAIIAALHENGYSSGDSLPVLDPAFDGKHHQDYDNQANGITREKFCNVHLAWIQHCAQQQHQSHFISAETITDESELVSLCFALAIYARRALLDACNHHYEFYLFGIHALFKGAFSPMSTKDQWLFADLDLVDLVVKPAIRMSIRLHLDNFISPDFLSPLERLYTIIDEYERTAVFAHESDPKWREAILNNTEKLLTLRHVVNESCESYRIITLDKKFLRFKIVKLNEECVRGLWAGQQQELIFLRNSNSERGSIQNARQALRNIINSSCDQPIGYPIYVSPLITSFVDSNKSVPRLMSESLQFSTLKDIIVSSWLSFVERCLDGCTSGRYSSGATGTGLFSPSSPGQNNIHNATIQNSNISMNVVDSSNNGAQTTQNFIAMSKHRHASGSLSYKDSSISSMPAATANEASIFVSATTLDNNSETVL